MRCSVVGASPVAASKRPPELTLGDEQRGGHRCNIGTSTGHQPSDAFGDQRVRGGCVGESLGNGSLQVRCRLLG